MYVRCHFVRSGFVWVLAGLDLFEMELWDISVSIDIREGKTCSSKMPLSPIHFWSLSGSHVSEAHFLIISSDPSLISLSSSSSVCLFTSILVVSSPLFASWCLFYIIVTRMGHIETPNLPRNGVTVVILHHFCWQYVEHYESVIDSCPCATMLFVVDIRKICDVWCFCLQYSAVATLNRRWWHGSDGNVLDIWLFLVISTLLLTDL